jgi:hypothetical protein
MSALVHPRLSIAELLGIEDEPRLTPDPDERCRFCECSDELPCAIPLREGPDGNFYLARSEQETTMLIPCSWFIPRVCSKPECVEKLLLEARGKVLLFDSQGNRAG